MESPLVIKSTSPTVRLSVTLCTAAVPKIMHLYVDNEQFTTCRPQVYIGKNSHRGLKQDLCFSSVKFPLKACLYPYFQVFTPTRATVPKMFGSSQSRGSLWLQTMPSLMSSRVSTLWNQAAPPDGSPVSPGSPCASLSTPTGGGKPARGPHLSRKREKNIQLRSSSPRWSDLRTTKEPLTVNRAVGRRRNESLNHS